MTEQDFSNAKATRRLAELLEQFINEKTDYEVVPAGMDDDFLGLELDAEHHELWVHNIPEESFGERLRDITEKFGTEATVTFDAALLFDISVTEYHEESNAEGYVFHVGDIRFNE